MTTQTTNLYETKINFEARPEYDSDHYQVEGFFSFDDHDGRTRDYPLIATAKPGESVEIMFYPAEWGGNPKGVTSDAADSEAFDAAADALRAALRERISALMD